MKFKTVLLQICYVIIMLACTQCSKSPDPSPPNNGGGNGNGAAAFTLQGSGGTCSNISINGTYMQGTTLTSSNTISVQVNVTSIGTWFIATNIVAGFSFSGSGIFTATGVQTVILSGSGIPGASGSQSFTVTAGNSSCTFPVTVNGGTGSYKIIPGRTISVFYNGDDTPDLIKVGGFTGEDVLRLEASSSGNRLKVQFSNLDANNVTMSQTGSNIFMRPGTVSTTPVTTTDAFNALSDTTGMHMSIVAENGGTITIAGQAYNRVIVPLYDGPGTSFVGDGSIVAKQPTFTMSTMAGVYANPLDTRNPAAGSNTYIIQ